jgi:prepilin-type N-terminal cleavage/methylation domain-containing protein
MKRLHHQSAIRGFSLIEVLIVTSVTLCIAATAIPKVVSTMANIELRAGVRSAAGVLQQARSLAIKEDKFRKVKYTNTAPGGVVYVDLNDDGAVQALEPQAQTGTTVLAYSVPSGIPALADTDLGYSPVTTTTVAFSSTGQPCNALHSCAVGMVIYFTDTRVVGSPGWAAVSISPAGRVGTWLWTGSHWSE